MKSKIIPLIIIISIILIIFGFYNIYTLNSEITIGNSKMIVPDEFQIIKSNDSLILFNDGENNVTLFSLPNSSVNKSVNNYTTSHRNYTIKLNHLNLSNKEVIITSLYDGNSTYINYWFENNNNTYLCHFNSLKTKNNTTKMDASVSLLINHLK